MLMHDTRLFDKLKVLPYLPGFCSLPPELAKLPKLAEEFPELLTWRDGILQKHLPALQPWYTRQG